jgi:hypothetical protein
MDNAPTRTKKDGQHLRIYYNLLDSHAWCALGPTEIALFIAMRRQLNGSNNGNIEATLSTMKLHGIRSPTTLAKALRALVAVGLIENLRPGRLTHGGKVPSLYRFTDLPCPANRKRDFGQQGCKATNEWQRFRTLAAARLAIESAEAQSGRKSLPTKSVKTASKLQEMESSDPNPGVDRSRKRSMPARQAPEPEVCEPIPGSLEGASLLALAADSGSDGSVVGKVQEMEPLCKLPGQRLARGAAHKQLVGAGGGHVQ